MTDPTFAEPASAPPSEPGVCGKYSRWARWGGVLGPCTKAPGHEGWHHDGDGAAWDGDGNA